MRVLLVEDHERVRMRLLSLLQSYPVVVAAEAVASQRAAITAARELRPDTIVMDLSLPDGSGVEAARRIRDDMPDVGILLHTSADHHRAQFAAVMAGASGAVPKTLSVLRLLGEIERVAGGGVLIDRARRAAILAERVERLEQVSGEAFDASAEASLIDAIVARETDVQIATGRGETVEAALARVLRLYRLLR